MSRQTDRSLSAYIENMDILAGALHPRAATALQLGLGAGFLPTEMTHRGVNVVAVEIEPSIEMLARRFFRLPTKVAVHIADARAFLQHDGARYDLVLLDTFASESTPWHMLTVEAFREMRDRLNPGGRLIINTVSFADVARPSMEGIESSLLAVFPNVMVYPGTPNTKEPDDLVNILIVAGEHLDPQMNQRMNPSGRRRLTDILSRGRPARGGYRLCTDDRSDLDYVQAPMRIRWRRFIWDSLSSGVLSD
jgi:spermidine synthase